MVLIIGGAYQGKRDYAKSAFGLKDTDVYTCCGPEVDFSGRCIDALEEFTYACTLEDTDPIAYFRDNRAAWQDSILICRDLFCGVVPMDARQRRWRQITGRLCQYLAGEADQVSRIFCGLEQRIK